MRHPNKIVLCRHSCRYKYYTALEYNNIGGVRCEYKYNNPHTKCQKDNLQCRIKVYEKTN